MTSLASSLASSFLIQTYSQQGDLLGTQVWDSRTPLGLGHPFHWVLEKTPQGIRIRDLQQATAQELHEPQLFGRSYGLGGNLKVQIFPLASAIANVAIKTPYLIPTPVDVAQDPARLKRSLFLSGTMLSFAILGSAVLSYLNPRSEEVLIPPQFAQIILHPPSNSAAESDSPDSGKSAAKAKEARGIVQALKSTEVKKQAQTLIKTGALALLQKSPLTSSLRSTNAIQKIFSTRTSALSTTRGPAALAKQTEGQGQGQLNMQTIGSGYGHASTGTGIKGQGQTFVSLDTPDAQVEEGLSRDEVGNVIHTHLAEVRYCYESAILKNASTQGKLVVDFVISKTGMVRSAKLNNSSISDSSLDQCIISHLTKWKFPKPKGGIDVAVSYPFIFKTLGK